MYKSWWKILAATLILYSVVGGLLINVPKLPILHESIRTVYFHVPMWIGMFIAYLVSVIYSIKYLKSNQVKHDLMAIEAVNTGLIFAAVGFASGMTWANFTWGDYWPNDPKLNSSAIATLLYLAYVVLRGSLDEEQKRAKISAIYNIFAFPVMLVLIFILPRLTDSLHPGNGGNPAFGQYDLDSRMKLVLYPAMIGWALMSVWILTIRYRIRILEDKQNQIS
jgi:heme exporter protein C